jgi:hypothetical protein
VRREREIIRKAGVRDQGSEVRDHGAVVRELGAEEWRGSFRAGPTRRRGHLWVCTPRVPLRFTRGYFRLLPPGGTCGAAGSASRMRFVVSQVPEAGSGSTQLRFWDASRLASFWRLVLLSFEAGAGRTWIEDGKKTTSSLTGSFRTLRARGLPPFRQ